MPGPLATATRVRELGGLDDSNAYNLFRLANDAALTARATEEIQLVSYWLQSRAGSNYATGNPVIDNVMAEAEAWMALRNMMQTLKLRRLVGSHWPLASEDNAQFESVTDVQIPEHIQLFIDQYMVVEQQGKPYAAPVMVIGTTVDRTQSPYLDQREQLDAIIDDVTGLPVPVFPLTTDGGEL